MSHKREKLLRDMLDAGLAIKSFVAGRSLEDYDRNLMLRSAVERQFEIIGEALRRLMALDAIIAARISDGQTIIDFRNIIAHGYDVLDNRVVWGTIEDDLARLNAEVTTLLQELQR